jgi:hypothetical protein
LSSAVHGQNRAKSPQNPGQDEIYFVFHSVLHSACGEVPIHLTRRGITVPTNKIKGFVLSAASPPPSV